MVKLAHMAGLVAALCLAAAAPAHAAFSPDLKVGLAPPTAGTSPALTAAMSQLSADTPIERFTLALPAGFTLAGAPGASACAVSDLRAGACQPATQVGAFAARIGSHVQFAGTIHKTGPTSFGMFMSVLDGAVSQAVEGSLTRRTSGAIDMKLDQLPAFPITILALRFWGGGHSFIRTPGQCGNYTIDGKFTSRLGELAIDRTLMPISGCAGVPAVQVANVRLSARRFKAGGSIYGTRTVIAWWASRTTDHTDLRIERRKRGRWRKVGVLVAAGNAGDNAVRWDGRLKNRALKPGRYRMRIEPAGSTPAKRVRFRILR